MNPRILIAEDDDQVRAMLCMALEQRGYDVVAAKNGKEALEFFKAGSFDLVSTDLDMPEMNGLGLAKAILEQAPGTIIMMFSGNDAGVEMFKALGGHSFYSKTDVIAYIQTLLALRTALIVKEAA